MKLRVDRESMSQVRSGVKKEKKIKSIISNGSYHLLKASRVSNWKSLQLSAFLTNQNQNERNRKKENKSFFLRLFYFNGGSTAFGLAD